MIDDLVLAEIRRLEQFLDAARRSRPSPPPRAPALSPWRYWRAIPGTGELRGCEGDLSHRRRFLLRDAVDAAAAFDDVERIDLQDVAAGEAVGQDRARLLVVRIVEGRHHDAAVRQIEVDIARLQQPPARSRCACCAAARSSTTSMARPCASRAARRRRISFLHRLEIGMRLRRRRHADDHPSRRRRNRRCCRHGRRSRRPRSPRPARARDARR